MQVKAIIYEDIWAPFFSSVGDIARAAVGLASLAGIIFCCLFLANLVFNRKFNIWLLLIGGGLLLLFGLGPAIGLLGLQVIPLT